jgi:hypothetical protein
MKAFGQKPFSSKLVCPDTILLKNDLVKNIWLEIIWSKKHSSKIIWL